MEQKYTKLSALVGDTFTIERVSEYQWKRWNQAEGKYEKSDTYQKDFKKTYTLETDKGLLDLSQGQLGTILETVSYKGEASLPGKTVQVKSNGKTGMDIRYFFNAVSSKKEDVEDNPFDY